MRILFVTNQIGTGGAEIFMLRLAWMLSRQHEVFLYEVYPTRKDLSTFIAHHVAKDFTPTFLHTLQLGAATDNLLWRVNGLLNRFGIRNTRVRMRQFLEGRFLRKQISKHGIQVVNAHLWEADLFVAKQLRSMPFVISMHGSFEKYNRLVDQQGNIVVDNVVYDRKHFDLATHTIFKKTSAVVLASERNRLLPDRHGFSGPITKIYYGYTPPDRTEAAVEKHTFIIGLFARGIEAKGWQVLIDAFEMLLKKGYDHIELQLGYTDHPYIASLKEKYVSEPRIRFLGFLADVEPVLRTWDLVVFPTYYAAESLPNTVIESLMNGKPVISTDAGDIADMLDIGSGERAGKIIPLTHQPPDPEAFANAIEEYLCDKGLLSKHRDYALAAGRKFDMNLCAEKYVQVFERILHP
ncbi:MAG: glycosyltransferase family 4 protein [Flavobacteriales bacterium]|nr:glycosyltransferase family 4 protein [Flavobacteriales bacterium]